MRECPPQAAVGCAVDEHGELKDAEDIEFYHSESATTPMPRKLAKGPKDRAPSRMQHSPAMESTQRRDPSKNRSKTATPLGNSKSAGDFTKAGTKRKVPGSNKDSDHSVESKASQKFMAGQTKRRRLDNVCVSDDEVAHGCGTPQVEQEAFRFNHLTDDVLGVFEPEGRQDRNGKRERGHLCLVCRSAKERKCWFKGGVSTLRTHIQRFWATHGNTYLEGCKKRNIEPHERAIPVDAKRNETPDDSQETLDDSSYQDAHDGSHDRPDQLTPTKERLLDHIIAHFISADVPFQSVEHESFHRLLKFSHPTLKESDIPTRTKLAEAVRERAHTVRQRLCDELRNVPGQVSITFDSRASTPIDHYLTVTAHYIDSSPSSPTPTRPQWKLKSRILGCRLVEAANKHDLAWHIVRVARQYGIRHKLGWVTSDNVALHDCTESIGSILFLENPEWTDTQHCVQCIRHIVHLSAKAVIDTLCFGSARSKNARDSTNDDDVISESGSGECEADEDVEFGEEDALGKLLLVTNSIRSTPRTCEYFTTLCRTKNLTPAPLLEWTRTCWLSVYDLLNYALPLREVIDELCTLSRLSGDGKYDGDQIHCQEWEDLIALKVALEEPWKAWSSFSTGATPMGWEVFMGLECMYDRWKSMSCNEHTSLWVLRCIGAGLIELRYWFGRIDNTDSYFKSVVLNPAIKSIPDAIGADQWRQRRYAKAMKAFQETFDCYALKYPARSSAATLTASETRPRCNPPINKGDPSSDSSQYGAGWLESIMANVRNHSEDNLRHELRRYLAAAREAPMTAEEVVNWWAQHASEYPILSRMALDYLPIQGSAVPSERAFSNSGLIGTTLPDGLAPEDFEDIQILRDAYRNGVFDSDVAQ